MIKALYNLKRISHSIQSVAAAIGSALEAEVVIVDKDLYIVGGTQKYRGIVGTYLDSNNYVTKEVLKNGKMIFIDNPGENDICKPCKNYKKCLDKVELNAPIIANNKVIGAISIVGVNEMQKKKISNNNKCLLNFINEMGDLIVSKISEQFISEQLKKEKEKFEIMVKSIGDGILSFDEYGTITHINPAAKNILKVSETDILNESLSDIIPNLKILEVLKSGKGFENIEVEHYVNGQVINYIATVKPLIVKKVIAGAVATIKETSELRKFAVSMVNVENNIEFKNIIGNSLPLKKVIGVAKTVAKSDSTVLICGESGVGKELFARSIHNESPRNKGPFISLNCTAIPETLLESEIFGYEAGAFTGAKKSGKPGKLELANEGTFFLDEIGDMPLYLQSKLLRVLQEKKIDKVGSIKLTPINVRFIAATNKNLELLVEEGKFREDLYYRIAVIPIQVPPLRKRKEDIPVLIDYFVKKFSRIMGKPNIKIDDKVLNFLVNLDWPGNIRQLENTIEYCLNVCKTSTITMKDLPKIIMPSTHIAEFLDLKQCRKNAEKSLINGMLNYYGDSLESKQIIADKLGINISSLYRLMKEYQCDN